MKRLLLLTILSLLGSLPVWGQGQQITAGPFPVGGLLYVCPVPSGGTPCPTPSAIFSNSGLSQSLANPITIAAQTTVTFFAASGQYTLEMPASGVQQVVGGGSSGGGGLTTPAGAVSALPEQANLLFAYFIPSTDAVTSCQLTDFSKNGNNAVGPCPGPSNPIAITNLGSATGGLFCNGNFTVSPIPLPTAVRGAQTITLLVRGAGLAGFTLTQAVIAGDGGGAAGHTWGLLFDKTQFTTPNMPAGWGLNTASSTTSSGPAVKTLTSAFPQFQYQVITVVLNDPLHSSLDAVYVDGNYIFTGSTGASLGAASVGKLNLCGVPSGSGFTGNVAFHGEIYAAIGWSGSFTYADHYKVNSILREYYALQGLQNLTCTISDTSCYQSTAPQNTGVGTDIITLAGDSIENQGDGAAFNVQGRNGVTPTIWNQSLISQPLAATVSFADNLFRSSFNQNAPRNTGIIEGGYDDAGVTDNALIGMFEAVCRKVHQYNGKCIPETWHDVTGRDSTKNAVGTAMLQGIGARWEDVADTAVFTELGANGASGNATNIPDGVHPAGFIQENYREPVRQAAYDRAWSTNNSWSSASPHAAAASAAVATTAGSQAGNIMTVTMAATPVECTVGNLAFVTGTTAATTAGAYNSDRASGRPVAWYIRTSTATQITYYSGQTGAGSITAQGTVQCASIKDFERYVTGTFGTGNETLPPCEWWSGHAIQYKNDSSGTVTLTVPWSGETIDNATIAAHSQATITSLRGTLPNAGCKWVTTQFAF